MSPSSILVADLMTPCPHTVDPVESVAVAHERMRSNGIRHLPVVEGEALRGMLSERDVQIVLSLVDVDPASVTVSHVMVRDPYCVSPGTPLLEVVERMASSKVGSAVVMENGRVVGIFTTVDALLGLRDALAGSVPVGGPA